MNKWGDRFDEQEISVPLGYLLNHVNDWAVFCMDIGLNPWLLNEGLAMSEDTHDVKIWILRKHGILPK